MDPLDGLLEMLDDLIETDMKELNYADFAQLLKVVDAKVAEFTAKAKKLSTKRDEIKEVVRLRMIEEKLPACDTENGRFKPTTTDCITMQNFEFFKDWLRDGFVIDIKEIFKSNNQLATNASEAFTKTIQKYLTSCKTNDRLDYLKQECFDKNKMKQMHTDSEDVLPPGVGIYQKHSLSITKVPKKKG